MSTGPRAFQIELMEYGCVAAALLAADQVGLLGALQRGGVQASGRAERLLLELLASAGLVDWRDGSAALSESGRGLDARIPGGIAGMLRLWRHLPTLLSSGEPLAHMDGTASERQSAYADAVAALGAMFEEAAADLAARLGSAADVLDVGAGSGVWSLAMIARTQDGRATAFDLPDVLDAFRARAAAAGVSSRVQAHPGDYHHDDAAAALAGRFERVVLANVLHLEEEGAAAAMVKRWSRALRPNGELVVVDSFADGAAPGQASAARAHAAYALLLAVRTRHGHAHARERIEAWLRDAGLSQLSFLPLAGALPSIGAIVARRAP